MEPERPVEGVEELARKLSKDASQERRHQLQGVPHPSGPDGAPRFLAWSDQGHVAIFPEQRFLYVHFSSQEGWPQRVSENIDLSMAALSSKACCLASGAGAEGGSQLLVRPLERWDKAVFSAPLSGQEAVEAVACGDSFVAALTSKRMLRVFTLSGLPLFATCTTGRSVALAARGQFLLIVTGSPGRRAPGHGEDDALDYKLLDVTSQSVRANGHLPLSSQARLRWVGFSEEALPLAIDSQGVVRALLGSEWSIVLELGEEEARAGPMWAVHAKNGALFCAEVGLAVEPQPPLFSSNVGDWAFAGSQSGSADGRPTEEGQGSFGLNAPLREFPWKLAVGPVIACGALAESTLREQLLARHLEEMEAIAPAPAEEGSRAAALAKAWRSKAFNLYGKLVQAGEVEKALDVSRHFIAAGGATRPLQLAQNFAEKAGCFRLADEVAALRGASASPEPCASPPSLGLLAAGVPLIGSKQPLPTKPGDAAELSTPPKLPAPSIWGATLGASAQDTSPMKPPALNPFARRPGPKGSAAAAAAAGAPTKAARERSRSKEKGKLPFGSGA